MKTFIKHLIIFLLLAVLIPSISIAGKKFTDYDEDTSPSSTDVLLKSAGGAGTTYSTIANIIQKAHGLSNGMLKISGGVMAIAIAGTDYSETGAWGSSSEKTISSGIISLTQQGYFTIDSEGDASTDDLDQITGLVAGDEIIVGPENDARTIVVKNGANMILTGGQDFTMNNTKDRMILLHIGSDVMLELSRSSGGD